MTKDDIFMPDDRYVAALVRQRDRIAAGLKLGGYDDTTPGDKSTSCTWGLCSEDKAAWPDSQDHLWPDQFEKHGRVAPRYREDHQKCPLDRRAKDSSDLNGCFYTCMFFKKGSEDMSAQSVVARYDMRLAEVQSN